MSGQSKIGSAFEAVANIAVGAATSMVTNAVVFPMYGFHPSLADNAGIMLIYTGISFARSYCLRRVFNRGVKS
jgi:hypothetical protein